MHAERIELRFQGLAFTPIESLGTPRVVVIQPRRQRTPRGCLRPGCGVQPSVTILLDSSLTTSILSLDLARRLRLKLVHEDRLNVKGIVRMTTYTTPGRPSRLASASAGVPHRHLGCQHRRGPTVHCQPSRPLAGSGGIPVGCQPGRPTFGHYVPVLATDFPHHPDRKFGNCTDPAGPAQPGRAGTMGEPRARLAVLSAPGCQRILDGRPTSESPGQPVRGSEGGARVLATGGRAGPYPVTPIRRMTALNLRGDVLPTGGGLTEPPVALRLAAPALLRDGRIRPRYASCRGRPQQNAASELPPTSIERLCALGQCGDHGWPSREDAHRKWPRPSWVGGRGTRGDRGIGIACDILTAGQAYVVPIRAPRRGGNSPSRVPVLPGITACPADVPKQPGCDADAQELSSHLAECLLPSPALTPTALLGRFESRKWSTRMRQLRPSSTTWERTESLKGLTPAATTEGADVGKPTENSPEDLVKMRSVLNKHECVFIGHGNALPSPARGSVCDIDVGDAKMLLKRLLEAEVIEYSTSAWASPIVIVLKKNGVDIRLCIDYRAVNLLTKLMSYPLPLIDEVLDNFEAVMWFLSLEMASGIRAILMADRTKLI
ncbi:hypothetical protein PybrP1_000229 [[Pythium] brassicae (nom. inval.)]|nr:hypothetical protein PybrP1_000229 [[Pythium] brassicae (nom. inval.)]